MKTLPHPHLENDNQANVRAANTPGQKSILPNSTRGIDGVMRTIRGRPERRHYASSNRGYWRPPPAVQSAIRRGDRKCRRLLS